jgi:hypothetical protein
MRILIALIALIRTLLKLIGALGLVLLLYSCSSATKPLFSLWTSSSSGLASEGIGNLDLTQMSFGSNALALSLTDGTICSGTMLLIGNETTGKVSLNLPTCTTIIPEWDYFRNSSDNLVLCPSDIHYNSDDTIGCFNYK